jgi:hypothetical protein
VSDSYISLRCPRCNALASVESEKAGQTIHCRRCENEMIVPGAAPGNRGRSGDDLIFLDDDASGLKDEDRRRSPASHGAAGKETVLDPAAGVDDQSDEIPELTDWSAYRRHAEQRHASSPAARDPGAPEYPPAPPDDGARLDEAEEKADDELDDLLITATQASPQPAASTGADPFAVDEFAALRIEGITPDDREFPLTCNVCGSLIYARESQIGTQVKCHDCYSLVTVPPPRKPLRSGAALPQAVPPVSSEDAGDDGYRLEPEIRLPPLDTTIDQSLGTIDFDDDDYFRRRRERESPADPPIFESGESDPQAEPREDSGRRTARESAGAGVDEYGLAPPDEEVEKSRPLPAVFESIDDLLDREPAATDPRANERDKPISVRPVDGETSARTGNKTQNKSENKTQKTAAAASRPAAGLQTAKPAVEPSAGTKKRTPEGEDILTPVAGFGGWLAKAFSVAVLPGNLVKIVLGAIVLGFGNLLLFSGLAYFGPETETIQKFWGYFLILVGSVPTLLVYFFLGVHSNATIRDAVEQRTSDGEWPDFSFSDLISQFIFVATSFWLAAIPGLIAGQIFWLVTGVFYFMPGMATMTSLLFAPFFLSSVVFNESPLALVSSEAFASVVKFRNRWIRYWLGAFFLAGLFVAALVGCSLGWVYGFLFPFIQLVLAIMLFWIAGDLTGHVVRYMEQKASS